MRLVCKHGEREVAKKTIVPPMTEFRVHNYVKYRAMAKMTTVLPNLQQLVSYQSTILIG